MLKTVGNNVGNIFRTMSGYEAKHYDFFFETDCGHAK